MCHKTEQKKTKNNLIRSIIKFSLARKVDILVRLVREIRRVENESRTKSLWGSRGDGVRQKKLLLFEKKRQHRSCEPAQNDVSEKQEQKSTQKEGGEGGGNWNTADTHIVIVEIVVFSYRRLAKQLTSRWFHRN
jgi:hypothetical protein